MSDKSRRKKIRRKLKKQQGQFGITSKPENKKEQPDGKDLQHKDGGRQPVSMQ